MFFEETLGVHFLMASDFFETCTVVLENFRYKYMKLVFSVHR